MMSNEPEVSPLSERVTLLEEGLVLYREIPVQTPESIKVMFAKLRALAVSRQGQPLAEVLDLRDVERPSPEVRRVLKAEMESIAKNVTHVAIVLGGNPVLRAMAKVFAHTLGFHSVSFHADMEQALNAARAVLQPR